MADEKAEKDIKKCGIIMPISNIDGCDESHWVEVREILSDAISSVNFEANIVSDSDDIGIIQKRIIQNLYDNPIVVCDVSGKNPNVMFELGMRLAFDKPTIIVKDNKTSYSFDTSPIEHLEYPRDLRFSQIVEFKKSLSKKIAATYKAATSDSNHTTFLKHFGTFRVAKLDEKEVSGSEMLLSEIHDLRSLVMSLNRRVRHKERDNMLNNSGYQTENVLLRLKKLMEQYKEEHGITRKLDMRKQREEVRDFLVDELPAPDYFREPKEWKSFFDTVFDLMY